MSVWSFIGISAVDRPEGGSKINSLHEAVRVYNECHDSEAEQLWCCWVDWLQNVFPQLFRQKTSNRNEKLRAVDVPL